MTRVLEASTQPITDVLQQGAAFVPGFFSDDLSVLDEASALFHQQISDKHRDYSFGLLRNLGPGHPVPHLVGKVIDLANASTEVRDGFVPPLPSNPGALARRFEPDQGIGWHRDNPILGMWLVMLVVMQGDGITKVGGTLPILGRRDPVEIHSQKADLLLLRGRFPFNTPVPYNRARPLHTARAGSNGREILGMY